MKKLIIKKILREGEMIPKYYGVAYRNIDMLTAVCYPIPLNIIVALWNKLVLWFKWGHKLYENGYTKGYSKGFNEGRSYAFNQYKDQVFRQELDTIISNFMGEIERVNKDIQEGHGAENIGWIHRFIDNEKKRISQKDL